MRAHALAWVRAVGALGGAALSAASCTLAPERSLWPEPAADLAILAPPVDAVHGGRLRRPRDIDMVVVHSIGGPLCRAGVIVFDDIEGDAVYWRDWFLRQTDKSIHYVIGRDGVIAAARPERRTGGHANDYAVRVGVNARSIGIELVNNGDGLDPFPPEQITATVALLTDIARRFDLGPYQVWTHQAVETRPMFCGGGAFPRRVDPGPAFPMEEVRRAMAARLAR